MTYENLNDDPSRQMCAPPPPPPPELPPPTLLNKCQNESTPLKGCLPDSKPTWKRISSGDDSKNYTDVKETLRKEMYYAIKKLPKWRKEEDLEEKSVWLSSISYVTPLIQEGPTCGLVVLELAMRLLQQKGENVNSIFEKARENCFTLQGEMFSAQNMLDLATSVFKCSGELLSGGLRKHKEELTTALQRGEPVLVPYDADANHEPTCKRGHKAHWTLLTGYLVRIPNIHADIEHIKYLGYSQDPVYPNLFHATSAKPEIQRLKFFLGCEEDLFVFARQGKSRHLGLWCFSSLSESNDNLVEFSPSRDDNDYVLPPGGVKEGLCGKAVILRP